MLFYLLFGIGLALRWRSFGFMFPMVVLAALVMAGIADSIVCEFALGMICGWFYLRGSSKAAGLLLATAGALLLVGSLVHPAVGSRLLIWGLPSALLVFGAAAAVQVRVRWLEYLGAASYSIYLVQVFTISGYFKLVSKLHPDVDGDVLIALGACCSVIAGCCVYAFIERPIAGYLAGKKANRGFVAVNAKH